MENGMTRRNFMKLGAAIGMEFVVSATGVGCIGKAEACGNSDGVFMTETYTKERVQSLIGAWVQDMLPENVSLDVQPMSVKCLGPVPYVVSVYRAGDRIPVGSVLAHVDKDKFKSELRDFLKRNDLIKDDSLSETDMRVEETVGVRYDSPETQRILNKAGVYIAWEDRRIFVAPFGKPVQRYIIKDNTQGLYIYQDSDGVIIQSVNRGDKLGNKMHIRFRKVRN